MIIEIELLMILLLLLISDIIFYIHFKDVKDTLKRISRSLQHENIVR